MEGSQQNPEQNCIFCQIASGKVKSKKIYEDEQLLGFLDINPVNPGHLLLIPKKHYSLMMQLPPKEAAHLFNVAQGLSNSLLKSLEAEGTTIYMANGAAAGQRAPHMILHIIPRYENDNLDFTMGEKEVDKNALEKFRQTLIPMVNQAFGLQEQPSKTENQTPQEEPKEQQNEKKDVSLDDIGKLFK